jgi:hypothetical protein
MEDVMYTLATQFEAVGAHVGIVTCRQCGAALLLDHRDTDVDPVSLHTLWHAEHDRDHLTVRPEAK